MNKWQVGGYLNSFSEYLWNRCYHLEGEGCLGFELGWWMGLSIWENHRMGCFDLVVEEKIFEFGVCWNYFEMEIGLWNCRMSLWMLRNFEGN